MLCTYGIGSVRTRGHINSCQSRRKSNVTTWDRCMERAYQIIVLLEFRLFACRLAAHVSKNVTPYDLDGNHSPVGSRWQMTCIVSTKYDVGPQLCLYPFSISQYLNAQIFNLGERTLTILSSCEVTIPLRFLTESRRRTFCLPNVPCMYSSVSPQSYWLPILWNVITVTSTELQDTFGSI